MSRYRAVNDPPRTTTECPTTHVSQSIGTTRLATVPPSAVADTKQRLAVVTSNSTMLNASNARSWTAADIGPFLQRSTLHDQYNGRLVSRQAHERRQVAARHRLRAPTDLLF